MILLKHILTVLGLDYRYALLIKFYFVVLGIGTKNSDQSNNYIT